MEDPPIPARKQSV